MRIIGYTYQAETWCPGCIVSALGLSSDWGTVETLLDDAAQARGIDREDEWSFDSDNFPKVVFSTQLDGVETCATCGGEL